MAERPVVHRESSYAYSEYDGLNPGWVTARGSLERMMWDLARLPPFPRLFWKLVARDYFLRAAF